MSSLFNNLKSHLLGITQRDGPSTTTTPWTTIAVIVVLVWVVASRWQSRSRFPTVNPSRFGLLSRGVRTDYLFNARGLLAEGHRKFSGPFNLATDHGPLVMLPPDYIDAVNAASNLSFPLHVRQAFLSKYETFRTFRPPPPGLFDEAVMKGLTRSLPKFTKDLSQEMASCLADSWSDLEEWHEVNIQDDIVAWIARLSSRIFLGTEFSTNKEWLRISADYTINAFIGLTVCRYMPSFLRWPVERLFPLCRKVRADYHASSRIFAPVFKKRHDEIAAAQAQGRKPDLPDDAIEWFRTAAKGREYNEMDLQLGLAVAAIHTSSDLLCQAVLNLCAHPEYFEPLRTEALDVLRKHGWQKMALTELRLLDSFFKETQRLKPIAMASMHRSAATDVELPNGVVIRKGEQMAISSHPMWSSENYEDPDKFDGFRFFERRKIPGLENRSLLVSTSSDHLGFSHGKHACPGRFFAANEVKIAMVHLLLNYDMKISDPSVAQWKAYGVNLITNPKAKISVRKRKVEFDLDI